MYLRVARLAQGHQVTDFIGAATRYREYMMYFFGENHLAFFKALFAERVLLDVAVADPFPAAAIFLMHIRRPLILIVLSTRFLAVLITVGPIRQVRTARISARLLRLSGHRITSFCETDAGPSI